MNVMIGNQYYLTHRYADAVEKYKSVLQVNNKNYEVKKKLIICYIKVNKVDEALNLFCELLKENIKIFLDNEFYSDDCPCRQVIFEYENSYLYVSDKMRFIVLGIIWFYCDYHKSQFYFRKLIKIDSENQVYKEILLLINNSIKQNKKENQNGKKSYNTSGILS